MFDHDWVDELDGSTACDAVAAAHRDLLEVETRLLMLAAQWIDLHGPTEEPDEDRQTRVLPGSGRFVPVGAAGTPEIDEFACAEFATLQDMHPVAGANLLRKVANLRHRHPLLWARALAGQVRGWKALEVAKLVGKSDYALSLEQARWVDAQTYEWIDTLAWGPFLELLEAKIIACDPEAAEARRKQAEADQFVSTGRSNEYGLTTLIAKAAAGDVIYFKAMCDRIAQILLLNGDTSPVGARRAKAIGILATPARALLLLQTAEANANQPDGHTGNDGDESDDGLRPGDLHPSQDDSDDDANQPAPRPCPSCAGAGTLVGDPTAFVKPPPVDPGKLLPNATVYLHLTQEAFATGRGVVRVEGVGPITVGQAQEFLGHCQVRFIQVRDLADRRPVNGYEFPSTTREAAGLINPRDVFPYAVSTSRRLEMDHPVPYLSPGNGGEPGQTNTGNAAPLVRFHHRLKTHGRWRLRQAEPGTYLWRSPHGWYWLTDHTGTHPLTRYIGETLWDALQKQPSATDAA